VTPLVWILKPASPLGAVLFSRLGQRKVGPALAACLLRSCIGGRSWSRFFHQGKGAAVHGQRPGALEIAGAGRGAPWAPRVLAGRADPGALRSAQRPGQVRAAVSRAGPLPYALVLDGGG